MTIDYIVSSLPPLAFGEKAPLSRDGFYARCGEHAARVAAFLAEGAWSDVETQIRNAIAVARGGEEFARPAAGCDVVLRDKVAACFRETDPAERERLLDKVRWDVAGELAKPSDPLGFGALAAYAARLEIATRRDRISSREGAEAFSRLLASAKERT